MTRQTSLAEAKTLLDELEEDLGDDGRLKFIHVNTEDSGLVIGGVRTVAGFPAIAPHPESQTLLYARQPYFDLMVNGPRIIADLVDLAENGAKTE